MTIQMVYNESGGRLHILFGELKLERKNPMSGLTASMAFIGPGTTCGGWLCLLKPYHRDILHCNVSRRDDKITVT